MDFEINDSAISYKVFDDKTIRTPVNNAPTSMYIKDQRINQTVHKKEIINTKGAEMCRIELGQAFPNPASNVFYFYYNVSSESFSDEMPVVKVIDVSGRIVYTMSLDHLTGEAKVILEDVSSGSYFIKIEYKGVSSDQIRINIDI